MSCPKCDLEPNDYPFRWGTATIVIQACEDHAKEVIEVLREAQK